VEGQVRIRRALRHSITLRRPLTIQTRRLIPAAVTAVAGRKAMLRWR